MWTRGSVDVQKTSMEVHLLRRPVGPKPSAPCGRNSEVERRESQGASTTRLCELPGRNKAKNERFESVLSTHWSLDFPRKSGLFLLYIWDLRPKSSWMSLNFSNNNWRNQRVWARPNTSKPSFFIAYLPSLCIIAKQFVHHLACSCDIFFLRMDVDVHRHLMVHVACHALQSLGIDILSCRCGQIK